MNTVDSRFSGPLEIVALNLTVSIFDPEILFLLSI
jgi:hypothetical protein